MPGEADPCPAPSEEDPSEPDVPAPPALTFGLLGPLEVTAAGESVAIGGTRQRIVLATLLLEAEQVIPTERLITAVWDDEPPATARTQIQICISRLRARLEELGAPGVITTHESGYRIRPPEDAFDLARFRRLLANGRDAARRHDRADAAASLRAALGLWRGAAAAGVPSRVVQAAAIRLDEERLAVTGECVDLELTLGRHREVIGELRSLVAAQPLRGKFYAQLMLALYRDGRQAEALEVYRDAHRVLVEEHGLDPSSELRALERAILDNDPAVALPVVETQDIIPRQLPAPAKGFVARSETVAEIRRTLSAAGANHVIVVSGPPGVGKTALVLHAAYATDELFVDGQLYAHLRGSDARPVPPEQVLNQFLRALGVAPAALPGDVDELAALYRSRLAERRVLVVLDDVAGAWQMERLVPGGSRGAVLVTSRSALPGLHGAHRFDLDVFSPEDSMLLLSHVLGDERVRAEPAAAATVATSCGHLPLALQIAAAKLSVRRHWQIARMAGRLGDESRRLDELSLDGAGVRASISVSFEALGVSPRRLLLLLGALGAADFAGWVAGPLLDVDTYDGADILDELVDARLVEVQQGAGHRARYRLHDLVGVFARELLVAEVPAGERAAAQHRLLRCWLFLARHAHRREYGGEFTVLHSQAPFWSLPAEVLDELLADPIDWFESEQANLVNAVRLAAELNVHELCWDLAVTSVTFFETRVHREDWRQTHEVALAAALRSGDQRAAAVVRLSRAGLAMVEQRLEDAESDLTDALDSFERSDDGHGRGLALRSLASIDRLQGRYAQAEERYQRALADLRAADDRVAEAHVLINLAQARSGHRWRPDAEQLLRRALAICDGVGVRRVAAQAHHRLGQLYLAEERLAEAEAEFTAMDTGVNTVDDPVGKAYALLGIGRVRLAHGDLAEAETALTEALERIRPTGSQLGEGQALVALAELSMRSGEESTARQRLDAAAELFQRIGAAAWQERVRELRRQAPSLRPAAD